MEVWWKNSQVLSHLFRDFRLEDLKSTRLVCRIWKEEGTQALHSKFKISLNHSETDEIFDDLAKFIHIHRLRHKLFLSLVDYSWFTHVGYLWFCRNFVYNIYKIEVVQTLPEYWKQGNNLQYFDHIFSLYINQGSAALIVSLHLELAVGNAADEKTLIKILSATRNLNTLFLDLISWEIPKFTTECPSFPNIKKFGLRIHSEMYEIFPEDFKYWLRMFPKIESIGTQVWSPDIGVIDKMSPCYEAILQLYMGNQHTFPNLKEIIGTSCLCADILHKVEIPISLEHITFILRNTSQIWECFQNVIIRHAPTLITFEVYWTRWRPPETSLQLLFLPVLRSLVLASHIIFPEYNETCRRCLYVRHGPNCLCWMDPREKLKEVDVFKLRSIFEGGPNGLKMYLPTLSSLTIALSYRNEDYLFFRYLFPDTELNGTLLRIRQMKYLAVSLSANCKSEDVQRLHRIFPELEALKHVRMSDKHFFVCEHRRKADGSYRVQPHKRRYALLNKYNWRQDQQPNNKYDIHSELKEERSEYDRFLFY